MNNHQINNTIPNNQSQGYQVQPAANNTSRPPINWVQVPNGRYLGKCSSAKVVKNSKIQLNFLPGDYNKTLPPNTMGIVSAFFAPNDANLLAILQGVFNPTMVSIAQQSGAAGITELCKSLKGLVFSFDSRCSDCGRYNNAYNVTLAAQPQPQPQPQQPTMLPNQQLAQVVQPQVEDIPFTPIATQINTQPEINITFDEDDIPPF